MSQASAQREPSMEEILASIRRIIEDSDTVPKPESPQEAADNAADAEIDAFLEELGSPVAPPRTIPAPANESARPKPATETAAAPIVAGTANAHLAKEVEAAIAAPAISAPQPAVIKDPAPQTAGAAETVEATASKAPLPADTIIANSMRSIVSVETGRQVQAAFGELSDVFQRSKSKPLDQVAEEMLRPMLQDWLDNNLPTLVERLVREEIERVARGE